MNARTLGIVVTLSWLAGACAPRAGGPLSDGERAALADSVRQFAGTMVETIDRHDVDGFINYHLKSPEVAWAESGRIVAVDSMRASMLQYFPSPAGVNAHFRLGDARVYVLGRDAAVVTAIINSTNVDSAGTSRQSHQAWSIVVQRQGGEWKVVQAHESYPARP